MTITMNNNNTQHRLEPHDNDIRAGRGNGSNRHPGNIYFRSIVEPYKTRYTAKDTSLIEKKDIITKITQKIESLNPPGRFLKKDSKTGIWSIMSAKQKERKTAQALREKQITNNHHDNDENDSKKNYDVHNPSATLVRDRSYIWSELVTNDDNNSSTTCHEESMVDLMSSVKSMDLETSKVNLMDVSQNICSYLDVSETPGTSAHHERRKTFPVAPSAILPPKITYNEFSNNVRHNVSPYYHQQEGVKDSPTESPRLKSFCALTLNNRQDTTVSNEYVPKSFQHINDVHPNTTCNNNVDADPSNQQQKQIPSTQSSSHPIHNNNTLSLGPSAFTRLECTGFASTPRRPTFPIPSNLNLSPDVFFSEKQTSNSSMAESAFNLSRLLSNDRCNDESMLFNESIAKIDFGQDSMRSISYGNLDECAKQN